MNEAQHPLMFLIQHPMAIVCLIVAYLFVVAAGNMPELPPNAGFFTRWAAASMQAIAGNIKEAAKIVRNVPQVKAAEAAAGIPQQPGLDG